MRHMWWCWMSIGLYLHRRPLSSPNNFESVSRESNKNLSKSRSVKKVFVSLMKIVSCIKRDNSNFQMWQAGYSVKQSAARGPVSCSSRGFYLQVVSISPRAYFLLPRQYVSEVNRKLGIDGYMRLLLWKGTGIAMDISEQRTEMERHATKKHKLIVGCIRDTVESILEWNQ